jgi:hypothetical protein
MTMLFSCSGPCNTVAACAVFPQTPKQGDAWFDTSTNEWKTWDGAAWIVVAGGGAGGAHDVVILPPPAAAAIQAQASPIAANTATVNITGGPSGGAGTVTVTYRVNGAGASQTFSASIGAGSTADEIANALVAAVPAVLKSTKTGVGTFSLGLGSAVSFDSLAIQVS